MAAKHYPAEALDNPLYEPLDGLTRSLHFSDLKQCYKKQMLVPHTLNSKVVVTSSVGKVLWFGPSKPAPTHNMYGNVSFSISMKDVVDRFGSNLYYIDQLEFTTHLATRILLSNKDHDELDEVDLSEQGSPLKRRRWRHVTKCDSEHSSVHPHEVEIGIEVNKEDCQWLYNACTVQGNNHSSANSLAGRSKRFMNHVCHRFNTFGITCPYSFDEDYSQTYLEERFPHLFEDESETESDESETGSDESKTGSDESETESDENNCNYYGYY